MIMNSLLKWIPAAAIFMLIASCTAPGSDSDSGPATASENGNNGSGEFTSEQFASQYEQFRLVKIAGPLENPWSVAFLPDGRYLVTERPGHLNIVDEGRITRLTGTPEVRARGQGGMMEVSVHPNYEENGWIYLTYSKGGEEGQTTTTLVRGRLNGSEFVDAEELFTQDRYSSPGRHYGSKLAWTNDGYLLMSIGDRGADPPRAQDLNDHAGTLLRLNDDGTPAAGNPFIGRNNALPEIYSYGHRNIQGLVVNPETNEIWATEHGPRGGDELNRIEAGNNYGWPVASLGRDYRTGGVYPSTERRYGAELGMIDPFYEFLPTLAPSGLALVTKDAFPAWKGNLLAGGLRSERIRRVVFDENEVIHEEELLLGAVGRIRDVREGPEGHIYILTDDSEGALYRIEPVD
jgi:aldose sugar dehydrogenase